MASGVLEQQRALPEVVQQQGGHHEREPAERIGRRPKWPMSAYRASPPVTTRKTAPSDQEAR